MFGVADDERFEFGGGGCLINIFPSVELFLPFSEMNQNIGIIFCYCSLVFSPARIGRQLVNVRFGILFEYVVEMGILFRFS